MPSKLILLGSALFAWGIVAALSALVLTDPRLHTALAFLALGSATGGLVVSIIGAARYERY